MENLNRFIYVMEQYVNRNISPKDEMFLYARAQIGNDKNALAYYFDTGKELATGLLKYVLDAGLNPKSLDVLDFAAGYGRVTRWLVPVYRTIITADLEQDMIDFHKREFGIQGFVSSVDPRVLASHRQSYDVIFVFSLFTHLPEATWLSWLKAIARLVKPGGHLVFSTHSYELFAQLSPEQYGDPRKWVKEFVFWEVNETNNRLKTSVYGCNIVKDSYVRRVANELPGFKVTKHYNKGEFDRYHDMYVIRNDSNL